MDAFPRDALEFQKTFSTEEQCERWIAQLRWPNGFVCPNCGHDDGYPIRTRGLIECTACHRQTSVTAGTIFHKTHLPLTVWFCVIYQMATDKGGTSARKLASQLDRPIKTMWHVMHKLRHAMGRRDEGITLAGFIEMDEAVLGPEARRPVAEDKRESENDSTKKPRKPRKFRLGRKPKDGRKRKTQTEVLVLAESERFHAGNVAMQMLERTAYETIRETVEQRVDPAQVFKGDAKQSHWAVKHMGHQFIARKSTPETACKELPIVHRIISLLKHFLVGTYFGVSPKYLPGYLQEFCFRFIRREKQESLCESLLRACIFTLPMTYAELR